MRSELNYRTFVIANPEAAAGRVREDWDLVDRLLRAKIPELDAAFTEGPGHATILAREALRAGWEMIVCVGGDGTLNEVVNGFFEKPRPADNYKRAGGWIRRDSDSELEPINEDAVLGVVPMGTGSDFRRTVGLMGGTRESIDHLSGRETRPIDIGQVTYLDFDGNLASRLFVNIASAGFSGSVDEVANNMWKGLGGKASFMLASTRAFLKWKNVDIDVLIGDTVERSG
ncbi:MAG: diacylglycerol kinase family protein, partial [Bradymonadaceae bacterium]